MTNSKAPQGAQLISNISFSPWRSAVFQPTTRGGEFVMRRYRVAPGVADLVADLAGLGREVR